MPKELQRLGRTIERWFEKITAYHLAKITNGPTEGLNNLIKRVKRVGFGFTNFKNYRIRALLYAGKPNWRVLDSIVVTYKLHLGRLTPLKAEEPIKWHNLILPQTKAGNYRS